VSRSRWFAHVELNAACTPGAVVLEQLERVLDAAQPSKVDADESYAIEVSLFLAHRDDCWGDIEVQVAEEHGDLISEVRTKRFSKSEFGVDWPTQIALEVDRILRGRWRIETTQWRGKTIRTTILDGSNGDTVHDVGSRWERLPLPARQLVRQTYELDYGCSARGIE
jgi:hypothetical protein